MTTFVLRRAPGSPALLPSAVRRIADAMLLELELGHAELSVLLSNDREIHALNLEHRNKDKPTDVLSFPAAEADPETGTPYLGDILISIPRAKQQAEAAGHSLEAEVQLLVVHGTLHLLGHDHAAAREKARMWKAQAEVMSKLGLSHVKIQDT